jgi:diaminopimelate epimerase
VRKTVQFFKYHGTGNDFIMIDDREETFPISRDRIAALCHRHYGIGADGLILIQPDQTVDFKMVYFNSDGRQSTMCGNGGRCAMRFAQELAMIDSEATFRAIDGLHEGLISDDGLIHLKMGDTPLAKESKGAWFMDTGSPHHVQQEPNVQQVPVAEAGRAKRLAYGKDGANVNFVSVKGDQLDVRTYERGVEDETLSCGTGVTAAALTAHQLGWVKNRNVRVNTPGGELEVRFQQHRDGFSDVWLIGPAAFVFKGEIELA